MENTDRNKGEFFKIRVGVVVVRDGKILLVRQNKRPFWVFPGGTLEQGESLSECAVREILEESGLHIQLGPMFGVADFMSDNRHVIDVFFQADYTSGDLVMETTENLDDIGFFSPQEMAGMAIEPQHIARKVLSEFETLSTVPNAYAGRYGN